MSIVGLERALHAYTKEPSAVPFDLKTVPLATTPMQEQVLKPGKTTLETPSVTTKAAPSAVSSRQDVYAGEWMKSTSDSGSHSGSFHILRKGSRQKQAGSQLNMQRG